MVRADFTRPPQTRASLKRPFYHASCAQRAGLVFSMTLEARLAWSVPVEPDVVAAHLQVHFNERARLNALRLCHRYGQGEHAIITKLPVELVTIIEDYVVADARGSALPSWRASFNCWRGLCQPTDHLDRAEVIVAARQCLGLEPQWSGDLTDSQSKRINKYMHYCIKRNVKDEMYNFSGWCERHKRRVEGWAGFVATSNRDSNSFSQFSRGLQQEFGLGVFAHHTRTRQYADQQIRRGGKLWSTEVFLFVPDQGFIRSHRHPGVTHLNPNNILDQNSVPENSIGGSFPIAMPKPLEEKDITKFKRAFLKLGITAMAPTFTASSTRKLPKTGEEQDSGDGS